MKLYQYILLTAVFIISIALNSLGLNWGLPSSARVNMVLPQQYQNEEFYRIMKNTREEIYKYSAGSAIGRVREENSVYTSPMFQSMDIKENENTAMPKTDKTLANLVRSYFLRTHSGDEQMPIAALASMHPKSFDFDPKIYPYGGVFIYGLGTVFSAGNALHLVHISRDISYYFNNPREMGKIFLLGRFMNVIYVALILLILFLLVKKIYSVNAAIIAAAVFAFYPMTVFQTHIMKPYVLGTLFSAACLYSSFMILISGDKTRFHNCHCEAAESGRGNLWFNNVNPKIASAAPRNDKKLYSTTTLYYILSGIFAGLTSGTIVIFSPIIIAPLLAHVFVSAKSNSGSSPGKYGLNKNLLFLTLVPLAVFFLTNPYWILNYKDVYWEMKANGACYTSAFSFRTLFNSFTSLIPSNISYELSLLCLAGIVYALYKRKTTEIILSVSGIIPLFIFAWLLQHQAKTMHLSRFLLPWFLILSIPAAAFADDMLKNKSARLIALPLIVFILVLSALRASLYTNNFIIDASQSSTRANAGEWINSSVPKGSSIGIIAMPQPSAIPPFSFSEYNMFLIQNTEIDKNLMPEYIVVMHNSERAMNEMLSKNYNLLKTFRPDNSLLGIKFSIIDSTINSAVNIYKRRSIK